MQRSHASGASDAWNRFSNAFIILAGELAETRRQLSLAHAGEGSLGLPLIESRIAADQSVVGTVMFRSHLKAT